MRSCLPLAARLCFLASLLPPCPRPSCTPGAVDVSLLCTSILRHWREPFSFNMRQVSMFPRCCCRVFGEKPRRRRPHCLPLDHPKATVLVKFDSGQRSTDERWPRPQRRLVYPLRFAASKSSGLHFSPSVSAESCRQTCFPKELFHLDGPDFLGSTSC